MMKAFRHPPAFYAIFMLEIWERFGYMSVMGILALFFTRELGLSQSHSFELFGAFTALIYTFIAVGGYIGDSILGAKRTILIGLVTLFVGYLTLGFGDKSTVYYGLSLVCVGTGLFKSNPSSLLSKCYSKDNTELIHNAFTLFYMAINIGSFLGVFFSPIIASHFGFSLSFILSAIGMILAIFTFIFSQKYLKNIATAAGIKPLCLKSLIAVLISLIISTLLVAFLLTKIFYAEIFLWSMFIIVVCSYLVICIKTTSGKKMSRMILAIILMFEAVVFQILYEQMQTSINFFAINNVQHSLLGIIINPQSFQALNPFWIVVLSPFLSYYYIHLKNRGINYTIYSKFASGMLLCALAFIVLYICKYTASSTGIVSSWWLVLSYLLQSAGELMISALGVAMVAELVPSAISGFTMGMWFVFLSIGNLLGGFVASLMGLPKDHISSLNSLAIYTQNFLYIGLFSLIIAIIMFITSKFKAKMI